MTVYGIVDVGIGFGTGNLSDRTSLTNSALIPSRIGFRGAEDLGGGNVASFVLESGIANDTGAGLATNTNNQTSGTPPASAGGQGLTFNRRSTLSLLGSYGEVRIGRDFTPQFWNLSVYDPFGSVGVGVGLPYANLITGPAGIRASNSISYFAPGGLGGFFGQAMVYLGENLKDGAATESDGNGTGIRLGYGTGPFNVAISTSRTEYALGNAHQSNVGGFYDVGPVRFMAYLTRDRRGETKAKGVSLGGLWTIGAGQVRFAYSQSETSAAGNPTAKKFALGYVHNLSKRTALYTTVARIGNQGGAAFALNGAAVSANNSSNGVDVGLRHSF
jgi:predicted porin